ncbi:galaxin-like [Pempheris klunzingeri]|uniref:galaxin-like n=1 Tax=Pempheris klunzingeri TaxID=3127111 RepID=UPI00398051AD
MCCGPLDNRTILLRQSNHHQCCGHDQYNTETQCCCWPNESSEVHPRNSTCCVEGSAFCGLSTYNPLSELCCLLTIAAKPVPNAQCCGKEAFDQDEQMCCGSLDNRTILLRQSNHHQCCGHDQYNTKTQCCCWMNESSEVHPRNSACCVEGSDVFDQDEQMYCGPLDNRTILLRKSSHHQCCGHDQYNTKTQCCCWPNELSEINPINSTCCVEESGMHQQKHRPQPTW